MADSASIDDGRIALASGAAILGTTLSGYTADTEDQNDGPDLALIAAFVELGADFVMGEGRINTPQLAALAMAAGASAVTVGSALTRLEHVTSWFSDAVKAAI